MQHFQGAFRGHFVVGIGRIVCKVSIVVLPRGLAVIGCIFNPQVISSVVASY